MDDYDWLKNNTSSWSDWSTHSNTKLDKYSILDLSVYHQLDFISSVEQYILLGYKVVDTSFNANDGTYIYSSNSGFRDQTGSFSGATVSYEESFESIYLGVALQKKFPSLIIGGVFKYSPAVISKSKDNHHKRYFVNTNTFDKTSMFDFGIKVEYPIRENLSIAYNYKNVRYKETKGNTTREYYSGATEATPGSVFVYNRAAGISNSYTSSTLSLVLKF